MSGNRGQRGGRWRSVSFRRGFKERTGAGALMKDCRMPHFRERSYAAWEWRGESQRRNWKQVQYLLPRDVEEREDVCICKQDFTICEYITNLECLLADKFNAKFYFEQQVNQYTKGGIPIAKCSLSSHILHFGGTSFRSFPGDQPILNERLRGLPKTIQRKLVKYAVTTCTWRYHRNFEAYWHFSFDSTHNIRI